MVVWAEPPPGVRLEGVSPANIDSLRTVNRVLFPINYSEKTYADILACGPVTQLALVDDQVVGAIACRLERTSEVGFTVGRPGAPCMRHW